MFPWHPTSRQRALRNARLPPGPAWNSDYWPCRPWLPLVLLCQAHASPEAIAGQGPTQYERPQFPGRSPKGRPSCCVAAALIVGPALGGLLSLLVLKFGGTSVADID